MFDLKSISKTKRIRAPKIVIAGPSKIGKTTFAASFPNAIGILTEEGSDRVDAHAFPLCQTLTDVYECINTLLNEDHKFDTVFLDSLDWLEPILWAHVCNENQWPNIEKPGFGKGYVAAAQEWKTLLAGLDALRDQKNMTIVLIAHDKIKRFEGPLREGYDTYTLKLNDKAVGLVCEWADVIGFASYEVLTRKVDAGAGRKEAKATGTGERLLYLEAHPAHFAGNRFGLKNMALDWAAFDAGLKEALK
ncbi:MAG: hypothetical protein BWZ03_00125 [bacterium ADurb.BinA186]|nr:MAG: hypothetical protein BWZ03_00125 [bacterium ADurb.BinA186]